MHEAVLAGENRDKGAEVDDAGDGAAVQLADFGFSGDGVDALERGVAGGGVFPVNPHDAVVVDIDRRAGFLGNRADHCAALADHVANLVLVDAQRGHARGILADIRPGFGNDLAHLAEDMLPGVMRLGEGLLHDFLGDALDLDVHLQGRDALGGAGDLEIHIAEVVLVAEDVGEHGETCVFLDQAHGDAGDRRPQGHPGIHHRQARAANRCH